MKNYRIVLAVVVSMLLVCSTASAARPYVVAPNPVVYGYWPAAPFYAYPSPVVRVTQMPVTTRVYMAPQIVTAEPGLATYPSPVTYPTPMIYPSQMIYPSPVTYRAAVIYPSPVVRGRVYYPGEPIRNTLRAVLP